VYTTTSSAIVKAEMGDKKRLLQKAMLINNSIEKRSFDLFVSLFFLLFIFSWLYPLIAIAIKLESGGLALFVQERMGLNGQVFKCYKFRTLKNNQVSTTPESLTMGYNAPVTKVGAFLRDKNLDELPQFINVLLGSMSIVGPRPHAIPFHNMYSEFISNINDRLLVKPGITGLAQIKGLRGDVEDKEQNKINIQQRIDCDIEYINNWSFAADLTIFKKTIFK
jgi:putative colanic acid biosynthesis UDP-glucose lipid carrier transferase